MAIHTYRTNQAWKGEIKIENNLHELFQFSQWIRNHYPSSYFDWSILPGGDWLAAVKFDLDGNEANLHMFNQRGLVGDFPLDAIMPELGSYEDLYLSFELYTRWRSRSNGTEIIIIFSAEVESKDRGVDISYLAHCVAGTDV